MRRKSGWSAYATLLEVTGSLGKNDAALPASVAGTRTRQTMGPYDKRFRRASVAPRRKRRAAPRSAIWPWDTAEPGRLPMPVSGKSDAVTDELRLVRGG